MNWEAEVRGREAGGGRWELGKGILEMGRKCSQTQMRCVKLGSVYKIVFIEAAIYLSSLA